MEKLRGKPASISPEVIAQIYELYDTQLYGYKRIAKMLNITLPKVIYYIRKRRRIENAAIDTQQQHFQ